MPLKKFRKFMGFFQAKGADKPEYVEVPDAEQFDKGILLCSKCGARLDFGESLKVENCPSCGTAAFIPMRFKDYLIYKPLGGGGEGFVYKARRANGEERFAVKFVPPSKRSERMLHERLLRDAGTISAIGSHKNIVELVESGKEDGNAYLVFRFIAGERLDEYIARKRHLSDKRALNIAMQIIEAEKHICSRGFLYRDLKPENILLEKNGNVKLCDFGLCIPESEALVHGLAHDELEGSPFYLPPERIMGHSEGQFSEIYSLGMILYHMLKGETYFSETEINELIAKHIEPATGKQMSEKLSTHNPKLVALIEKMTAQDPAHRYRDFSSMMKDLEAIEDEVVQKPTLFLQTKTRKIKISELKKDA